MKIISKHRKQPLHAFTLIEMIGVLAVIAILASMLIPKIFEAINNSKINNAAVSYNTVKAGLADHYAKWGSLLSSNGTIFATSDLSYATNYDKILVSEGWLDKTFQVKIGSTNTHVQVVTALAFGAAVGDTDASYDLDGVGGNDANGGVVVEAVITGATENDARDLSLRLDGDKLSTAATGSADHLGRVKYAVGSPTDIYIYVTHR